MTPLQEMTDIPLPTLGQSVEDSETGFKGAVTGIAIYKHSPPLCFVENDHTTRWIEATRLT